MEMPPPVPENQTNQTNGYQFADRYVNNILAIYVVIRTVMNSFFLILYSEVQEIAANIFLAIKCVFNKVEDFVCNVELDIKTSRTI